VSGAIATAMITTIVSFLPVFAMEAQEGKMFSPLAYTKTYALASAFVLGLILLPTLSYILFSVRIDSKRIRKVPHYILIPAGVLLSVLYSNIPALGLTAVGLNNLLAHRWKKPGISNYINIGIALVVATYFLAEEWLPMGPQKGIIVNLLFVTGCIAIILALLWLLVIYYERILRWCLNNRWKFMLLPIATILCGILIWKRIGQEFMPSLNEGSFLLMPTSMPHTGIEQNLNYIEALDKRLAAIPEVETAIGKWGRVNSALDPAPAQMIQSENTFLVGYVIFDKKQGKAEVDVVKEAIKSDRRKDTKRRVETNKWRFLQVCRKLRTTGTCHCPADDRRSPGLADRPPGSVFPVQDPYGLVDSFLRCLRGFCRRLYPALAVRSGLVHELFAGGSQYAGPVPDAYH